MKKIMIILGAMLFVLLGVQPAAQAADKAQCWTGGQTPYKSGFSALGEATFRCTDGFVKPGVPVLSQRILNMQMEALLQVQNPTTKEWETRDTGGPVARNSAGTLRIELQAGCLAVIGGGTSRLWRVLITYAIADQSDKSTWDFYGESSPLGEIECT